MAKPKEYIVHDKITGKFLAEGTARYCAEVIGVVPSSIRSISKNEWNSSRFVVKEIVNEDQQGNIDRRSKSAARKWDLFCAPIRAFYGKPVHGQEG